MSQQLILENPEILQQLKDYNTDIVLLAGHIGNWEWVPGVVCPGGFDLLGIYKPQSNKTADEVTKLIRQKKQVRPVPMKDTAREINRVDDQSNPRMILLISDQIPAKPDINFWLPFLNQDTAWFISAGKIAERYHLPVVFLKMKEEANWKYSCKLHLIKGPHQEMTPEDIIVRYVALLEESILDQPHNWLWSHRRWKHKREQLS